MAAEAKHHHLQDEHYEWDGWLAAYCLLLQAASKSILWDWRADHRWAAAKHRLPHCWTAAERYLWDFQAEAESFLRDQWAAHHRAAAEWEAPQLMC